MRDAINVVCIGDCGIDHYESDIAGKHDLRVAGGCALNVAINMRKTAPSIKVEVVSGLGDDLDSAVVTKALAEHGVRSSFEILAGRTPTQFIQIDEKGERHFSKYDEGILKSYLPSASQCQKLRSADCIVTVVFSQIQALFHHVLQVAKPARLDGTLVVVDFMNMSDFGYNSSFVAKHIDNFDIAFFGLKSQQTALLEDLRDLAKAKEKLFVVTLGHDGATAFAGAALHRQKAYRAPQIIDTTGAGDSFAGAFLGAYLEHKNIPSALDIGARHASAIVGILGAYLVPGAFAPGTCPDERSEEGSPR